MKSENRKKRGKQHITFCTICRNRSIVQSFIHRVGITTWRSARAGLLKIILIRICLFVQCPSEQMCGITFYFSYLFTGCNIRFHVNHVIKMDFYLFARAYVCMWFPNENGEHTRTGRLTSSNLIRNLHTTLCSMVLGVKKSGLFVTHVLNFNYYWLLTWVWVHICLSNWRRCETETVQTKSCVRFVAEKQNLERRKTDNTDHINIKIWFWSASHAKGENAGTA